MFNVTNNKNSCPELFWKNRCSVSNFTHSKFHHRCFHVNFLKNVRTGLCRTTLNNWINSKNTNKVTNAVQEKPWKMVWLDKEKVALNKFWNEVLKNLSWRNLEAYLCVLFPTSIYLLKVNNRNTRIGYEICWKLTIKTLKGRQ